MNYPIFCFRNVHFIFEFFKYIALCVNKINFLIRWHLPLVLYSLLHCYSTERGWPYFCHCILYSTHCPEHSMCSCSLNKWTHSKFWQPAVLMFENKHFLNSVNYFLSSPRNSLEEGGDWVEMMLKSLFFLIFEKVLKKVREPARGTPWEREYRSEGTSSKGLRGNNTCYA